MSHQLRGPGFSPGPLPQQGNNKCLKACPVPSPCHPAAPPPGACPLPSPPRPAPPPSACTQLHLGTLRYAMIEVLKSPPPGFEDVVVRHFRLLRRRIMATATQWVAEAGLVDEVTQQRMDTAVVELHGLLARLDKQPGSAGGDVGGGGGDGGDMVQ